jgi:hypothetical protein
VYSPYNISVKDYTKILHMIYISDVPFIQGNISLSGASPEEK